MFCQKATHLNDKESRFQILPVPFLLNDDQNIEDDHSASEILKASNRLVPLAKRENPFLEKIYTHTPVPFCASPEQLLTNIEEKISKIIEAPMNNAPLPHAQIKPLPTLKQLPCLGAPVIPCILGGSSLNLVAGVRAVTKHYRKKVGILYFSAHSGLRADESLSPFHQYNVLKTLHKEQPLSVFQVGVRTLTDEEQNVRKQESFYQLDGEKLRCPRPWPSHCSGKSASGRPIPPLLPVDFPETVFLYFSANAFDMTLIPAAKDQEPGGLFWWDALHLIKRSLAGRILLGITMAEHIPNKSLPDCSYTLAKCLYEVFAMMRPYANPTEAGKT